MKTLVLLFALIGTNDVHDTYLYDTFDCVEYNHFYDERGKHIFDQFIMKNWNPETKRMECEGCFLISEFSSGSFFKSNSGYYTFILSRSIIQNEKKTNLGDEARIIQSRILEETWTQYDPEILAQTEEKSKRFRKGLKKYKHDKPY